MSVPCICTPQESVPGKKLIVVSSHGENAPLFSAPCLRHREHSVQRPRRRSDFQSSPRSMNCASELHKLVAFFGEGWMQRESQIHLWELLPATSLILLSQLPDIIISIEHYRTSSINCILQSPDKFSCYQIYQSLALDSVHPPRSHFTLAYFSHILVMQ
jgi:hypothetical protein